jgi:hypothetical protein
MNRFVLWLSAASLLVILGCGPSAPAVGHTVIAGNLFQLRLRFNADVGKVRAIFPCIADVRGMSSGGLRTRKDVVGIEQQSRCGRVCGLVESSGREGATRGSGCRADT